MQTETPPTTDTTSNAALVAKLRSAFESGRTRPIEWRRRQLERMKTMLVEHETDFLDALAADLGKPRLEGWATDIGVVITELE
jgi:aldehyde dehydrogenase (NAD+)